MQMDEATILKIALEIKMHHGTKDQKMHVFSSKYPEFVKAYPTLFAACMDPLFKLEYLKMMLHKRKDVQAGRTTLDEADKDVYGTLQQRYIHPLINANASSNGTAQAQAQAHAGASTSGSGGSSSGS